jgi:two-component sensor histidine kinase
MLFFLSLLFACHFLSAQNYDSIYNKLSGNLLRFESTAVINKVDSILLVSNVSETIKNDFRSLKVEAFAEFSFFTQALELSDEIVSNLNNISEKAEVRVRVQRALIFEIFQKPDETISELNRLEEIYKTKKKDRYFGQYLFRKSSYYRVLKPVEKSDSLALLYANKAADFGNKNKYYDVSAIAKMLQDFFIDKNDYEKRMQFLQGSLNDFKLLENQLSMSMMYTSLASISQNNNQLVKAKKFIDSALTEAKKTDDLHLKSYVFKQRASFLESINQRDSAFYYFKKFYEAESAINIEKQNLEVLEINYNNKIETEKKAVLSTSKILKETQKKNTILYVFIVGIIFLLTVIVYLYSKLNKKKKKIDVQNNLLQKTIHQKELLLKELNHRVKNNLSLIISLIKFQSNEMKDDFYKEKFKQLENRIHTIAIAHEQFIYSENEVADKFYNIEAYLQKISEPLINLSTRKINYNQTIENLELNIDTALPIGILMNELISNSIEHAVTNDVLIITTCIKFKDDKIMIMYSDSGIIFKSKQNNDSLGLFIIDSMIQQLNGSIVRTNSTFNIVLNYKN